MGVYDFQKSTADRIAAIFRSATIDANGHEIKCGGQRRVLLADEVGLGKTIVAREVINRVRDLRRNLGDDTFRVVYVCSNMSIAAQNIHKLGISEQLAVSESRLSMQHLIIARKDRNLKEMAGGGMPELLVPLTPGTSFSHGSSLGNIPERALIWAVLSSIEPYNYKRYDDRLKTFCRGRYVSENSGSWLWYTDKYRKEVAEMGRDYIEMLAEKLDIYPIYLQIKEQLLEILDNHSETQLDPVPIIAELRRIFADISLSMLEPDLIVMDEFQRFSSLLDYNADNEQSAIVRKFFEQRDGQEPLILLLSATPYKPFSTLEELTEYNTDTHYEDFNRLMDFLFHGKSDFREIWSNYSNCLTHLSSDSFDVILASKNRAESKMYQAMCRTERLNEGLISVKTVLEVTISSDDIISYCQMQKIVSACKDAASRSSRRQFSWSNMPIEYVKSSPYLLSFMESYELKKQIENIYQGNFKDLPAPDSYTILKENDLANFHKLSMRNARLQYLRDMMLPKGKNAELLLWVPASKPYYTTNSQNPFVKNRDFSKTLVFSAWEMVPRMIACMMSYEAEREVIFSKYQKARYDASTGEGRLKDNSRKILTYASPYLASFYRPEEWYGRPISEIRRAVKAKIEERLKGIRLCNRRSYARFLSVLEWLDGQTEFYPTEIHVNTIDLLTDMAIAGPGSCLYRILGEKSLAEQAAQGFVTTFNRRIAGYAIDKFQDKYHSDEFYLDGVMDYCVMGNLQAVLDEYRHICGSEKEFVECMGQSFIDASILRIDTDRSFGREHDDKFAMRTFYAVPFAKGKTTATDRTLQRTNNIRVAFNSPFYPFIVASTSVGQEGLDFHQYCRKIVHWNLPSNPQALEQREGRINRYKCLAIRRNLARLSQKYDWDSIFEETRHKVQDEFGDKYSEIVPAWCLPTEWVERYRDNLEWIERIVPEYPMSIDVDRYHHLIDVLALYRLTMGQPRQEELLELLHSRHLTPDQISALLFNLSPISKK